MNLPICEERRPSVRLNPGKYTVVVDGDYNVIALFSITSNALEYVRVYGMPSGRLHTVEVTE